MTRILIVGTSGLVGKDLIRILTINKYENITHCNRDNFKECINSLENYDVVFNCANNEVSKIILDKLENIPVGIYRPIYIDNSSYLRYRDDIPLVVPEINMKKSEVYANPNCVTIILCLFLDRIKKYNPKNINVSTYQSISGAGKETLIKFLNDTGRVIDNIKPTIPESKITGNDLGFAFYPHESEKDNNGFNGEENKMMKETKKILGLEIFPTCIRIPSIRCHGETVTCEFDREITKEELINELDSEGIFYSDDIISLDLEKEFKVGVTHIRQNPYNKKEWSFFLMADQLTRGASYNAYHIFRLVEQTL